MKKTHRKGWITVLFYLLLLIFCPSCEQSPGLNIGDPVVDPESPVQPESGILLSVIVPEGLTLTGESRVLIERLDGDGFEPLSIPVTGTIQEYKAALPAGLYSLDILLVDAGKKSYSSHEEIEVKAPVYTEEGEWDGVSTLLPMSFEPEAGAFLSESEQANLTVNLTISPTSVNSAGLKVTKSGGGGAALTREMSALNGSNPVYLAVKRKTSQTLSMSGPVTTATGTAGGDAPGITDVKRGIYRDVLIIDSSSIADYSGGTMQFTITASEPGKNSITYTVTLSTPGIVNSYVGVTTVNLDGDKQWGELYSPKYTYLVGEAFDPSNVTVQCYYSDGSKRTETVYDVVGLDTSKAGTCGVQFRRGGQALGLATWDDITDSVTNTVTFTVLELKPPHLFFDYGRRISAKDDVPGRYTVTEGRKLVIAPVLWRIPEGATFNWTVSGTGASTESNGEFLTFKPGTAAGNYTVTVTATWDGGGQAQAETTVECVNGNTTSAQAPGTPTNTMRLAPGNHLWYAGSLGGFGGYEINSVTIMNEAGKDLNVGGNAFGGWQEPGIVSVMKDENGNGFPDDTWYELRGNADESAITRRYAVTFYKTHAWEDNLGRWGSIASDWPESYSDLDEMTFVGAAMSWDYVAHTMYLSGYADVNDIRCEIDNAVQVDGTTLDPPLDKIDFVKQHTGVHAYTKTFGEVSTETDAAFPLHSWTNPITGASVSGGYSYRFVNNSGYDVNIYLRDHTADIIVPAGTTVTVKLSVSSTYYKVAGGNVKYSVSGNTLTFQNK